ncbi:MAG: DUF2288 domain-containing protein [Gammaproteobacteria bacterium]
MQTKPKAQTELRDTELRDKINRETARLPWSELQRHFAQGSVVYVSESLDLVDVAVRVSHDDKDSITRWMGEGKIAKVSDQQAQTWAAAEAVLWACVVSPFVLVQPQKTTLH